MSNYKGRQTTPRKVMLKDAFLSGFADAKFDMGFSVNEYDLMNKDDQFSYERGRQFHFIAPEIKKIRRGKGIASDALYAFSKAIQERSII